MYKPESLTKQSTIQNMIDNNVKAIQTTMQHYLRHNTIRDKGMKEELEEWNLTEDGKQWLKNITKTFHK